MEKLDLTVIILTKNEEIHIARVIDNVKPIASRVIVVDSISTDRTVEIAREHGAEVVDMPWRGNQAEQFNHALDTIDITTEWILRLDADEWLEQALIDEMRVTVPSLPEEVTAGLIPRGRTFMGRRLKHGIVNSVRIIRLFRRGYGRYEQMLMDEHLRVSSGLVHIFKNKFVDDNLLPLSNFIEKHIDYANREAAMILSEQLGISSLSRSCENGRMSKTIALKHRQKSRYARMPKFWRASGYFIYRYIFRLGFLDGKEGFLWDYMQGWWYRTLVDAKLLEIEKATGMDPEKVSAYLKERNLL